MDEDIVRWILEYLLRQPVDDHLLNSILSILPIENSDSRLKKTLLLRRIESEVSKSSVSEKILEFLEIIEELDHREGRSSSEAMKLAYCGVAVDCTVRFLDEDVEKNRKYFETVKRIWRRRVGEMEKEKNGGGLVSEKLIRWKEEIEDAGWDPIVREKILRVNTRGEAAKAVKVYLAEAWEEMGPAFLQLAAQRIREPRGFRMEGTRDFEPQGGLGSGELLNSDHGCHDLIVHNAPVVSATGDGFVGNASVVGTCGTGGVEDDLVADGCVAGACGTGRVDDGSVAGGAVDGPCGGGPVSQGHENVIAAVNKDTEKGSSKSRRKHIGPHGRHFKTVAGISRGIKITEIDGMDVNLCRAKGDHLLGTPEVHAVQESLKSSLAELHKVVEDPLPSALQLAEEILARIRRNSDMNGAATTEDYTGEAHIPSSRIDNAVEDKQQKENISIDVQGSEGNLGWKDGNNQKVNDRYLGSVVGRWDDFIDSSAGPSSTRPRLPSPKSGNVSPLGSLATFEKFTRRRKRKMWSPQEEDTLREGVKKFGVGNWKLIYNAYREVFKDRTDVDLKDKWRNLTR